MFKIKKTFLIPYVLLTPSDCMMVFVILMYFRKGTNFRSGCIINFVVCINN